MRKLATIVLVMVTLVAACGDGGPDRPALTAWQPAWLGLRDLLPDPDRIEDDGVEVCSKFLGEVRARRAGVIPTPDPSLDDPVTEWVAEAETVGLDCEREGDLAKRLADLDMRAEEIDARIDLLPE